MFGIGRTRTARHLRPDGDVPPATTRRARFVARLRDLDDWRQVLILRIVIPIILAVVSAYYLTRWAHMNAMPWALALTIPAALDVTAYMAVLVLNHPTNGWAKTRAYLLTILCVVLSVAGNIGAHAVDFGVLAPNFYTVAATASVYPLVLIAGHLVATGMTARPLTVAQVELQRAAELHARAQRVAADEEVRAARRRPTPPPAPAAPAVPAVRVEGPPAPAPATAPAGELRTTATDMELHAEAVDYLTDNPGSGRRKLLGHLQSKLDPTLTDHRVKAIHRAALDDIAARDGVTRDDTDEDDETTAAA